jgi:hypothetical protein
MESCSSSVSSIPDTYPGAAAPLRFLHRKFKKMAIRSIAGGLVDPQSTKLQPNPTLKSPAYPEPLYPYQSQPGKEEEKEDEEVEMEDEEVEMDPTEWEKIWAALKAAHDAATPEMMNMLADDCEYVRKLNSQRPLPLEMLGYLGSSCYC